MRKTLLLLTIILCSNISFGQDYFMTGRFSNTTPDITAGIDSAIFIFTPTTYEYYINDNSTPSSTGGYHVAPGGNLDTLYLYEDSLGVCAQNGGGVTVWFNLDYTVNPYYSLIITESANSVTNCPSHSEKIKGDYIAWDGIIFPFPTSTGTIVPQNSLQAHVYNGVLSISSGKDEQVSVTVMNMAGQRVIKERPATIVGGSKVEISLNDLPPGMYFAVVQSANDRKAIKFIL